MKQPDDYLKLAATVRCFHHCWITLSLVSSIASLTLAFCGQFRLMAIVNLPNLMMFLAQLAWGGCPLTALERSCRIRGGQAVENTSGSFICDCLEETWGIRVHPMVITAVTVLIAVAPIWFCLKILS